MKRFFLTFKPSHRLRRAGWIKKNLNGNSQVRRILQHLHTKVSYQVLIERFYLERLIKEKLSSFHRAGERERERELVRTKEPISGRASL